MADFIKYHKQHHLKNYDYSTCTSYMITICVSDKTKILSSVIQHSEQELPSCELTVYGKIVEKYLLELFSVFSNAQLDRYVIMPDHIHFLFTINSPFSNEKTAQIPLMVQWFKAHVTTQLQQSIFQKNYYDTIADSDRRFDNCYEYIRNNPAAWMLKHRKEPDLEVAGFSR